MLLTCVIFATDYFLDPNNEYIYAALEGFEAYYDENEQSLTVFNADLNLFLNISKLSEPVEGLGLTTLVQEIKKSLENSGFKILTTDERDFQKYRATSFETLSTQNNILVRVEFTIFEVPNRGFYMILSATQDESYDSLRMVIRAAKMMLMFIE
jgi:hypothetical protein